jgi:hypothetical protein
MMKKKLYDVFKRKNFLEEAGICYFQAEHRFYKIIRSDKHLKRMMNAFEQAIKSKVGV